MRFDPELRAQLEAMADHRELTLTGMVERTCEVAIQARQRACSQTHRLDQRCGMCGLLLQTPVTTDDL